jgi:hypothetical protein
MDIALFRTDFPEFADIAIFPSSALTFWSNLGEQLISADRFGGTFTQAVELFTAHNIVLAAGNVSSAAAGGVPGQTGGTVSSKAVGSVSISYDTASAMETGSGHWNQTIYGRQYIRLARLIGQGCYQL